MDRWERATHTWEENNAQFVEQNAVIQDGYLILCLTDDTTFGYSGGALGILQNDNNTANTAVVVFPNPFNNSFSIQLKNLMGSSIKEVHLFDLKGGLVFSTKQFTFNNNMINISLNKKILSSGIYYGELLMQDIKYYFKLTYVQ